MLIYLVGQDRKSEEEDEGATALPGPLSGPPDDGGKMDEDYSNPLGLEMDPYWQEDVQEQRVCTFSR